MNIRLNDAELEALAGLPHLVICLYVMAIRPRMDYASGLVGAAPRISWHALTEWLYVEPHQGDARTGPVGVQVVRRAAARLVTAGLLKMRSSEVHRQLVFLCPLASTDSHARKKADIKPTDQADRPPQRENTTKADRPAPAKADRHPVSGFTPARTTTTTEKLGAGGGCDDLIFPPGLTDSERAAIKGLIERHALNGSSQLMLDELAGAMASKAIHSRVSYARSLVYAIKAETFTPEKAHTVRDARERQKQLAENEQHQATAVKPPTPEQLAKGEALMAKIRRRTGVKNANRNERG